MHPVLHVSLLKKKMGEGVLISSELSVMGEGLSFCNLG
jgi:hypothetical protein